MVDFTDIEKERHLPRFLQDFHDQKEVIKTMYWYFQKADMDMYVQSSTDAHCLIIDRFLSFMFLHGYKIQKTRDKDVCDIHESIETRREMEREVLKSFINNKLGD